MQQIERACRAHRMRRCPEKEVIALSADRRQPEDPLDLLTERVVRLEKQFVQDLATVKRDLLETIQDHRGQQREAHTRLRGDFSQIEERMNSLSRALADQRDAFTSFSKTPVEAANLHLTTRQWVGSIIALSALILGWAASWNNISNRLDVQFAIQAERNTALTAAMSEVTKAQKMSEEKRIQDYDRISRAFQDAQRGAKQP